MKPTNYLSLADLSIGKHLRHKTSESRLVDSDYEEDSKTRIFELVKK